MLDLQREACLVEQNGLAAGSVSRGVKQERGAVEAYSKFISPTAHHRCAKSDAFWEKEGRKRELVGGRNPTQSSLTQA